MLTDTRNAHLRSSVSLLANNRYRLAGFVAILTPLLLGIYNIFIAPRPYFIHEMDIEPDYYYNAWVITEGLPVPGVHHPGTPIYYLGALLLKITGADLDKTQQFFNLAYIVTALSTVVALAIFSRLLLKKLPLGLSILVYASILLWPPFLTYLNYYGSDSFIVALGLPTIAIFWKGLEHHRWTFRNQLFLCGIGLGACLAIKMTFLPVAAALLLAGSIQTLRSTRAELLQRAMLWRRTLLQCVYCLLAMPIGLVIGNITFAMPILGRLPSVWLNTFYRQDAYPPSGTLISAFTTTFWQISKVDLPLALMMALLLVAWFVCLLALVYYYVIGKHKISANDNSSDDFDFISGGVMITLLALGFIYTTASSFSVSIGAEPGVRLRNASPTALVFPFMILYYYQFLKTYVRPEGSGRKFIQILFGLGGSAVILLGMSSYASKREAFITSHIGQIEETRNALMGLRHQGGRIAFWNGADDDYLGEAAFHFWGNYRYAYDYFDRRLVEHYPGFTFYKLREIGRSRLFDNDQENVDAPDGKSRFGFIGDLVWAFSRWAKANSPSNTRTREIIVGESYGIRPTLIAFPLRQLEEESRVLTQEDVLAFTQKKLDASRIWSARIGTVDWVFIEVPDTLPKS